MALEILGQHLSVIVYLNLLLAILFNNISVLRKFKIDSFLDKKRIFFQNYGSPYQNFDLFVFF